MTDDEEDDTYIPAISVREGNVDTTTSTLSSKYLDEYEFNQQHPDSIHNKNNVTEKMSNDISDKGTTAESLSSRSLTPSRQVYLESKANVFYNILTAYEIERFSFHGYG